MGSVAAFVTKYRSWIGSIAAVALIILAPTVMSAYSLGLLSKYLCYAMVAVGIGLAWGQGGMLTLGQGLFFGLGAYVMAIHLKIEELGPDAVPDFMAQYGIDRLPGFWELFRNPVVTIIGVAVVRAPLRRPSVGPCSAEACVAPTSRSFPKRWSPRSPCCLLASPRPRAAPMA